MLGILLAVIQRNQDPARRGQVIDAALYESVFNLMEGVVPEYSGAGVIREPSGSTLTGIVPTNTYRCQDGRFVIIGGNGDSIYKRLMVAMGRPDLANDPRMTDNAGRVRHEKELDEAIGTWTGSLTAAKVLEMMEEAEVPAGPIYSVADMLKDPHFNARGLFEEVEVNGESLKIPAMMPFLSETPGRTEWPGPAVGAHNDDILGDLKGQLTSLDGLKNVGVEFVGKAGEAARQLQSAGQNIRSTVDDATNKAKDAADELKKGVEGIRGLIPGKKD